MLTIIFQNKVDSLIWQAKHKNHAAPCLSIIAKTLQQQETPVSAPSLSPSRVSSISAEH